MAFGSTFKRVLYSGAGAAALSLVSAGAGVAQDVDALEARIAELEAMIGALRDDLAEVRETSEQTGDRVIELERRETAPVATTAAASPDANGFMAGNTRVGYGGFIDLDAHATDLNDGQIAPTSIARDFYIPGAIPVGAGNAGDAFTDFTAQGSRFFFTTETPTDFGPVTSRLEFDFLGSPGGDERVSNSYNPRMRVAWAQVGNWRIGQDWSTFQNTSAIPESASFLVASDGMIFVRQAQIRYTAGNFQFSVENPDTTVTPFGGGGRIDAGQGAMPDLVARYDHGGDWGNLSLSALARDLAVDGPGVEANTFGWGLAAQGRIELGEGSDLRFSLAGGEGMGRYIGLNAVNGAVVTASNELEAIPSYGGLVAWRQSLGEGRRVSLGYSHLEADNDVTLTGLSATRRVYSAFGAYLVTLAPGITVGAEVLFGERELESGESGSLSRFTFSTKYSF